MADETLSQDEVNALLEGADKGQIPPEDPNPVYELFDFTSQERIITGLTALYAINERFVRGFRGSLINLFHRAVEVNINEIVTQNCSEYFASTPTPSCINLIRMRPLSGTALIAFDTGLVYTLVHTFFGGIASPDIRRTAKEDFTPMELRIVELVLNHIFEDLREAWASLLQIDFEHVDTEINPALINAISPNEIVVVKHYMIKLETGEGGFNIVIPYSMIEPIRSVLEAGLKRESEEINEHWANALREELFDAEVMLGGALADADIDLRAMSNFKVGDVIPIRMLPHVTIKAEEMPVFRGKFGISNSKYAVKISGRAGRE